MTPLASGAVAGVDRAARGVEQGWHLIDRGWRMCATPPGACDDPAALASTAPDWLPASVPGTAAGALRDAARFDWTEAANLDDLDHWFRCVLTEMPEPGAGVSLVFGGLATLAEVWLDGERLLVSDNMFIEHRIDVSQRLAGGAVTLHVCCRSLTGRLAERRPRASWRTSLVGHRNLRFLRTSLLGRMPGICPGVPVIGPWREVWLHCHAEPALESLRVAPELDGDRGRVSVSGRCRIDGAEPQRVTAALTVGDAQAPLTVVPDDGGFSFSGTLEIDRPALWWPHTHGRPHRYPAALDIRIDGVGQRIPLTPVGFRRIEIDQADGAFALRVNGLEVFCRGACWTPVDFLGHSPDPDRLRAALDTVVAAGMNMLRVPGNSVYEHDRFHDLCDELGVLVWQDFMFANMDYPFGDDGFRASVLAEVTQQLNRLGHRPSLAVLCGGSEVQQQAAMLGLPESTWRVAWFEQELAAICRARRADVGYVPGSPSGGLLPFHVDAGPGHYFGVGGYRRPVSDAWLTEPRFASECLAFGVPPEPGTPDAGAADPATLLARTPRDAGADWDFVDVSEHYARDLFGIDAAALRGRAPDRHLLLCRAAAGEAMSRVQSVWRRPEAACRGALVWLLRDFWPGAGWGLLGADGRPKATWFHLKRCWQPRALMFLDRGLNGLRVLVTNDAAEALEGRLSVSLERFDGVRVAGGNVPLSVPARGVGEVAVEQIVGSFVDSAYAYRFGPASFDVVHAAVESPDGNLQAVHVRDGACPPEVAASGVDATLKTTPAGVPELAIRSDAFLHTVALETPGWTPTDNYFHLLPGRPARVTLEGGDSPTEATCRVSALNLPGGPIDAARRSGDRP